MKIGVVFPQTEFGSDPVAIRDYAQAAEALGFAHIVAYDHVLGANPDRPGGWSGPYTHLTPFHEPFVLFSYGMKSNTSRSTKTFIRVAAASRNKSPYCASCGPNRWLHSMADGIPFLMLA